MNPENLYTYAGQYVATVLQPPWAVKPEVVVWGERTFLLRSNGKYEEARGIALATEVATTP